VTTDAVWLLPAAYGVGVVVFALVGALEWAMSAGEMRRIDRDEWSHGEPWQVAHNNRARDRERVSIDHAATLITYSPIWPLLVVGVLVRIATRHRKERATHE
jgi:hypothetical protein